MNVLNIIASKIVFTKHMQQIENFLLSEYMPKCSINSYPSSMCYYQVRSTITLCFIVALHQGRKESNAELPTNLIRISNGASGH